MIAPVGEHILLDVFIKVLLHGVQVSEVVALRSFLFVERPALARLLELTASAEKHFFFYFFIQQPSMHLIT